MKKLFRLLALVLTPSALFGCAGMPSPMTSLQIKGVLEGFAEAAEQGDVESIGEWVHDDVYHWGMESGRIHRGRGELMAALREDASAGEDFAVAIDPQLVSLRKVSDNVVIVDLLMVYEGHVDKTGTTHGVFKEPTIVVFANRNEGWKIISVYAAGNRADTYLMGEGQ